MAAAQSAGVKRILGMRFGVEGLLHRNLVDLGAQPRSFFARLRSTPAAVLGSCRHRLSDTDLEGVLAAIRRERIAHVIYIGGNDSADTSHRIHTAAEAAGLQLTVVGVPKTIDNDLPETDHCPG